MPTLLSSVRENPRDGAPIVSIELGPVAGII